MGTLKGKPHRKFTQAEKLAYISEFQDAHISQSKFAKEHGLNLSMFERWMKEYAEQGEASLASHRDRGGNRYAALHTRLILDFGISKVSNLKKTLDQYVLYFNSERFAAALDYKTPIQYRTELGF